MADGILEAVNTEIAALEAELSKDLRFQKLEHLRALRDLYTADDPNDIAKPVNKGEQNKAMLEARDFIASQEGPVPTTDVLDYLRAKNFRIGGADPRNNLSAMLSNTGWFEANGRKGWTIKEEVAERPGTSFGRSTGASPPWATTASRRMGPPPPKPPAPSSGGLDDDIPF